MAGVLAVGVIGGAAGCAAEESTTVSADGSESSDSSSPAPNTPLQQPESSAPAPQASTPPPAPTTPPAPAVDFVMPDFVGMDLQSAQDLVQTNNVWLSVSHDLLGSRNQVLDSNWMVCDQNIPPGQRVTGDVEGGIDFGVVKREESCP